MRRLLAAATAAASLLALAGCDDRTPAEPAADVALRRSGPSDPGFPGGFDLQVVGRYEGGGAGAAEITAYDDVSRRLFVVNGARGDVDVLDLRDPSRPVKVGTITPGLGAVNSVAAHDGLIALAIQATDKVSPGTVAFHSALTLRKISEVSVGSLPDMLTFTPSGKQVVVANEGEPNADYSIDPEGSVSIIDVRNRNRPSVRTASFRRFIGREDALRARGIRIYGPNANAAQDFEPEYVAVDEHERFAYVTLQENNAIATVDLRTATVLTVSPLGYKDHRRARNAFDPSDRDGGVNIRNWPVFGMYQPDAVAAYTVGGQTYLITANEGDARDYAGFAEEARAGASSVVLNPAVFTPEACNGIACRDNAALGRLTITTALGRNPTTGQFDALYALGGRSFSIWSAAGGAVWQVYDSGDALERLTATTPYFNFNHEENGIDNRSDNKGPEPEGVTVAKIGRRSYAFLVLERSGGVVAYDVTRPWAPTFVTSINTRGPAAGPATGDLGPEGVEFIEARRSPTRRPLVVVGHEVSGTTVIYELVAR